MTPAEVFAEAMQQHTVELHDTIQLFGTELQLAGTQADMVLAVGELASRVGVYALRLCAEIAAALERLER